MSKFSFNVVCELQRSSTVIADPVHHKYKR